MTFEEYQQESRKTAKYPKESALFYPVLGLCGEAGEVADKIKKVYRDNDGVFSEEKKQEIKKELGDVLWYIAQICSEHGINLDEVAQMNLDKLFSRMDRGVLGGSGDNR